MTVTFDRRPVFDAVRQILGRGFSQQEVERLDAVLDRIVPAVGEPGEGGASNTFPSAASREIGEAGIDLIKRFEGCARERPDGLFESYPDPGSADGLPWTIGWGSTGKEIGPRTVWTQAQCDARLATDLRRYADDVAVAIGEAATTQNEFDALVSFHYNTGAIGHATLTRLHRRGDRAGAAREFMRWVHSDGKVLQGLVNRRRAEAELYAGPAD